MFETDLHSHTLFSSCGLHTVLEMLNAGRDAGLKGLAVTDHGPALGGRLNSSFFERLSRPVPGIQLFKGMECNPVDEEGNLDMVSRFLPWIDLVLAGLHDNMPREMDADRATALLIRVLEKNSFVDMITHPANREFSVHFRPLAEAALSRGAVLELNNSKVKLSRGDPGRHRELIRTCRDVGCPVAVNTDAHTVEELGDTRAIERLMEEENFPLELVVNRTLESTLAFLDARRRYKNP